MNVKISYLYRDGANYKQFNEVIFTNPQNVPVSEIEKSIKSFLIKGTWFFADNWSLPNQFFDDYMWNNEIEHNWHEMECIKETTLDATETITIEDFINQIINSAQ